MPSPQNDILTKKLVAEKPLVVLVGPTAVGKSDLAIELAERLNGEIISADSRLIYRGMDIGTAKPSAEDRARIKHHLIDVSTPDEAWTLSRFQRTANKVIKEIHSRNKLPIFVGGTGQYVRAVIEGWDIPKVKPQPELRKSLERWADDIGRDELHKRLMILDPISGAKIDPTNLRRTIRALEVILTTGKLFSEQKGQSPPPYQILIVGLERPRSELYARVDTRINKMLEAGLIEEVKELLEAGYSPRLPALSAIGYREIIAYLEGKISLIEAIQEIKRNTRIFVRRQANWFGSDDPIINWFPMDDDTENRIVNYVLVWLDSL